MTAKTIQLVIGRLGVRVPSPAQRNTQVSANTPADEGTETEAHVSQLVSHVLRGLLILATVLALCTVTSPADARRSQSHTLVVHDAYGSYDGDGSWAYCVYCSGFPAVWAAAPSRASMLIEDMEVGDLVTLSRESWGVWYVCWTTGMELRESMCPTAGGDQGASLHTVLADGSQVDVWLTDGRSGRMPS